MRAAAIAALCLLSPVPGCSESGRREQDQPALERLLERPWRRGTQKLSAADVVAIELCGEVRPGFIASDAGIAGEPFECDVELPAGPSWLDVEVAVLALEGESAPPPPARLIVALRRGEQETPLYDGVPSAGTPPTAFGFGRARIELAVTPSQSSAGRATLLFRVLRHDAAGEPPLPACRIALATPRLSPRVTAAVRPRAEIDFYCRGPDRDELAASDAASRWPAFARLVAAGAVWTTGSDASPRAPTSRAIDGESDRATERQRYGGNAGFPLHPWRAADGDFDAVILFDPCLSGAASAGRFAADPFVAAHAAWDAALLRDRVRALGEHRLFRELARPRVAALAVEVGTNAEGAELDGALARLIAHLEANDLLGTATLRVHVVRGQPPTRSGTWER